jgi:threonine dehydratase
MLDDEERAAGVVAASAGNHGQAVAWAAREVGAKARIFMPEDAPMAKVEATRHYGADVELTGPAIEEALDACGAYAADSGATFIHPFEDPRVIAGQGTIGLELVDQVEDIETAVIPIGGGGLASGIALALRSAKPRMRIVGVQAEGTLPGGSGYTIADGIAVKKPGELTMSILERVLDDIVAVGDEEISDAIVVLLERTKLVVEGAGAVGVAALLSDKVGGNGTVVPVLSGGNIDATLLISVARHGLAVGGRYLVLRTRVPDRPGELAKLLTLLAEERVNVVEVEHQRETAGLPVAMTGVELTLVTRDASHREEILTTLERLGYPAERLA